MGVWRKRAHAPTSKGKNPAVGASGMAVTSYPPGSSAGRVSGNAGVAAVCALIVIALPVLYILYPRSAPGFGPMPPIPDEPAARKQVFFDYLRPIVRAGNARISQDRRLYEVLAADAEHGWYDRLRWRYLLRRYRAADLPTRAEQSAVLDRRIQGVPESLVLAQAAKESSWGRSRFAREGNALFGERCFTPGCGIVPQQRAERARHEVESFASPVDSVESYLLNLNTHDRYAELRKERQRLMTLGLPVTGLALAPFTVAYSERGVVYTEEISGLIRANGLEIAYD